MWINRNPQIWEKGHRDNACQCDSHHIEHKPELKQTEGYRFSERGQCQGMDIWQQQDRESYWKTQWNLRSNRRQGNRQNHHYHHYEERHKENSHDNCQKACCQNQKNY